MDGFCGWDFFLPDGFDLVFAGVVIFGLRLPFWLVAGGVIGVVWLVIGIGVRIGDFLGADDYVKVSDGVDHGFDFFDAVYEAGDGDDEFRAIARWHVGDLDQEVFDFDEHLVADAFVAFTDEGGFEVFFPCDGIVLRFQLAFPELERADRDSGGFVRLFDVAEIEDEFTDGE